MSVAEVMPPYSDEAPRLSNRTPPQDMEAEQCVLGAMLMSKDAIADVVEVLRGADFYRPSHEQVYNAVIDLYGRGEPADAITVADELGKRGELLRIGGAPYLHTLLASVPVAANAGYYAQIVHEKAILRRLVEASVRIGQLSYAAEGDVDDIVDRAQAEVYSVTERRASEDYKPLSELMQPTLDEMEAIESRGAGLSGVPTGFADLDELTNGLHPGQMVIIAARPAVGKSTLALDFARSASIKNGLTSVIFSLEMSQIEITMRLLSAEASIPFTHSRWPDERSGLESGLGEDGPGLRGADVHRRLAQLDDDGDSSEGAPAQAAARPQAGDHRLHPADDLGQEGGISPTRGLRVLSATQAAGQGARRASRRTLPAQSRPGAADGQETDAL